LLASVAIGDCSNANRSYAPARGESIAKASRRSVGSVMLASGSAAPLFAPGRPLSRGRPAGVIEIERLAAGDSPLARPVGLRSQSREIFLKSSGSRKLNPSEARDRQQRRAGDRGVKRIFPE